MTSEHNTTRSGESLPEQFHAWRVTSGLTVEDIAHELSFSPAIVQAFEDGAYGVFSAHIYAYGYLKQIVDHFSISTGGELMRELRNEWDMLQGKKELTPVPVLKRKRINFYLTPRRLFGILGSVVFLFFFWFLVVQVAGFTTSPKFYLYEPAADKAIYTPVIKVRGKTDKESQLTVNGREIRMDGLGNFNQEIELIPGVNTLDFLVKNRFGKMSTVTRHIIVQ